MQTTVAAFGLFLLTCNRNRVNLDGASFVSKHHWSINKWKKQHFVFLYVPFNQCEHWLFSEEPNFQWIFVLKLVILYSFLWMFDHLYKNDDENRLRRDCIWHNGKVTNNIIMETEVTFFFIFINIFARWQAAK